MIKVSAIVSKYNLDYQAIMDYIKMRSMPLKEGFLFDQVEESYVDEIVSGARKMMEEKAAYEEKLEKESQSILISSGFSFEGYKITKYSGYISGDDVVQIPREGLFSGSTGGNLSQALVKIRRQALKELKAAAYELG